MTYGRTASKDGGIPLNAPSDAGLLAGAKRLPEPLRQPVRPWQRKGIMAMTCLLALLGLFWVVIPTAFLLWFLLASLKDALKGPRPSWRRAPASPFARSDAPSGAVLQEHYRSPRRQMPTSNELRLPG